MNLARKLLLSLMLAAACCGSLTAATWSSFSQTTTNPGNGFSAGTVDLSDNDAGAAFSLPAMSPGTSGSRCIRVISGGSLQSNVRLYASVSGSLAQYLNLVITRGSDSAPSFPSCSNFSADSTAYVGAGAGVVYSGALDAFAAAHSAYANGLVDAPGSPATWSLSEAHSYKLTVALPSGAPTAAQGLTANATFTWEAQNQ